MDFKEFNFKDALEVDISHWEYRVCKLKVIDLDAEEMGDSDPNLTVTGIYEVYYNHDNKPIGVVLEPASLEDDDISLLEIKYSSIGAAFLKPILTDDDFED